MYQKMPASIMATNPIGQLKSLQTKLQSEREERRRVEQEACEKLRGYKEQFDVQLKEKDDLIQSLKEELKAKELKASFQSVSNEPLKQEAVHEKESEDRESEDRESEDRESEDRESS